MKKTWSVSNVSTLLVIAAILVVVNLIGLRIFARADLTEQSIYTLSQASRNVVGNLNDRLTVKAYFTKDLPPPYNANARYVRDILEDYRTYGNGNFYFEFVDPADEEQLEKEAQSYRVQPAQVNVMEKDALQLKKVYMGLVLIYGTKHETIPLIQSVNSFEYEMTSTIKRLVAEKLPKVGFLTNYGTPDLQQDLRTVTTQLSRYYEIVPVNTKSGAEMIPDDVDVLCIVAPKEPIDNWTKFVVDQFVMRGGKVAWFVNKVQGEASTSQATQLQLDVDDWTRRYGFTVANNLVLDANGAMINIQRQQGMFMMTNLVRYACFPEVTDFNQDQPITKGLNSGTFFFPSSIDTVTPSEGSVHITPLIQSSELTNVQVGQFDINPETRRDRTQFTGGKKLFAAALTGSFPSYFKGRGVPMPADSLSAAPAVNILTESSDTRMVVVGDGNMLGGQYMQQGGPNLVLFLNIVDWLSQDTDLLAIRSRDAAVRQLDPNITDETKQRVKIADMIVPPALVLLLGAYRWSRRRKKKEVTL
jgi:gliding-associated putative ABC transporter substrate-binding component GldG